MAIQMKKTGLLLINLGTPDGPDPDSVGRYLREFLMDRYVITMPWFLRWILVNLIIVPRRKHASSELYKMIWTERGSPLLFHLQDLAEQVRHKAGNKFEVAIAMRYGRPSISQGLKALSHCEKILVFPLYPQYAESTTRSSEEACLAAAENLDLKTQLHFVGTFYQHPAFIDPSARLLKDSVHETDHVLMTFHGLPESHLKATDRSQGAHCLKSVDCCAKITDVNRDCYRAQCFATARALTTKAGLESKKVSISFQSRLGRAEWIKPYTEHEIDRLAATGVRHLTITCPAFAADCLETLEEIEGRGAEQFIERGGKTVNVVECLNARPEWAEGVIRLAEEALSKKTDAP